MFYTTELPRRLSTSEFSFLIYLFCACVISGEQKWSSGVLLGAVGQYNPAPFPLGDNRRDVSPFWGDVDTRKRGTVLYSDSIDPVLLDRATKDVRRGFVDHQKF